MTKRRAKASIPSRDTGRAHAWFNPRDAGYSSLGDYESCRFCGVCKNARNENTTTCKGLVRIEMR